MRLWRIALASLVTVVSFSACDGDDTPPSFFDSGSDASIVDGATDVTVDAPPQTHAKIVAVHASPDLAPVRVCFAIGVQNDGSDAKIAPIQPIPKAALDPGTGGPLADLGIDLSHSALVPYVFLASKIGASTATCDTLVAADVSGTDYFVLPIIKNGTFAANATILLALTGCLPAAIDSSADITTCGPSYDGTKGNLALQIFSLDRVIANASRFGAQIVHSASAASGVYTALYGASALSATLHPFDGGAEEIISDAVQYPNIDPSSAASLAMPTIDQTALALSAINPDGGASPINVSIPLPLVYEATTGQVTGENAYFVAGTNYTFVLVGDPRASTTLDGGIFNGYSFHALAFPNDPTLPTQ